MELATKRSFPLVTTPEDDTSGILHPHFSHDGTKLTWTEMIEAPAFLQGYGSWVIKVADVSFDETGPRLTKVERHQPGGSGWYENHGLSPDGRSLLFTSTFEETKPFHANVYSFDVPSSRLKLLARGKWNEHALFSPSGRRIVWMTGNDNPNRGTDYWAMNPDGSDKVRLTDWNNPASPAYRRKMIVAADASFSPDGRFLVAYLQVNLLSQDGLTVLVELQPDWERPGRP